MEEPPNMNLRNIFWAVFYANFYVCLGEGELQNGIYKFLDD